MKAVAQTMGPRQAGAGLVDVMVGLVIGMLVMLVVYQVFQSSEGQKRAITSGSDAQANAAYGLYLLGHDLSVAGNAIATLNPPPPLGAPAPPPVFDCALAKDNPLAPGMPALPLLRPIPVVINAGATVSDPDSLTIFYGGSGSLSTSVAFLSPATITAGTPDPYKVRSPVGFSANDYIVATQRAAGVTTCTLSIVKAGGVTVAGDGTATIAHTPIAGDLATTYPAVSTSLVNLGQAGSVGRVLYFVDPATRTLATQQMLPPVAAPTAVPVVAEVINLKAQYGLDTDNDGTVDVWQSATGQWSSANVPVQPLATTISQIRAVRVAIVTRSAQYEKDPVTNGPLQMFDGSISMNLTADQQHYRYKVLETAVPLRNAIWNAL